MDATEPPLPRTVADASGLPPMVPSLALRRPRLLQLLDAFPDRRVVVVRGPAGAGKTVLVAQWVRNSSVPCDWVTTDPAPGRRAPLDAALRRAADWRLGERILVLDDVHRLRDERALHALRMLVERPPAGLRLVLVSRTKPDLGLERARLRGDLQEIRSTALRFHRGEIATLAAGWNGGSGRAADLEQDTLGWAAGLRLAQLESSPPDPGVGVLADCQGGVLGSYVREELIEASSAELRRFLEITCWVPVLTQRLCASVAEQISHGHPSSQRDLEALPILPIASRPGTFHYPPILTRALQQEYMRSDPEAAAESRKAAARVCRRSGDLVTSIDLLLQADAPQEAAEVCAELADQGEHALRRVDEVLQRTPVPPDDPDWLPWRVRAAVAGGRIEEADATLVAATEPETDPIRLARAVVAERVGDAETLIAAADGLLKSGPATDWRAHGWRIRALAWSGSVVRAREEVLAIAPATSATWPEIPTDLTLAALWVAWAEGDARPGADGFGPSALWDGDDTVTTAEHALLVGAAHREANRLAKAVPYLQQAHRLALAAPHLIVAAVAASELARCHRTSGSPMDGLELVAPIRFRHPDLPATVASHVCSTEVQLRLDQGDAAGAESLLQDRPAGVDTALLAARVAVHRQDFDRARATLEDIAGLTPRQAVEKLLLQAQMLDTEPGTQAARLIDAIALGRRLGLVRAFLDEGPTIKQRLVELAPETDDRDFGRLAALACQELAQSPTGENHAPVEPLTPRELAVLRMLPLRLSNREMAAQMYVSVNTLKTHIRAIYRKLDVPHRSAAVRRAKALELV